MYINTLCFWKYALVYCAFKNIHYYIMFLTLHINKLCFKNIH